MRHNNIVYSYLTVFLIVVNATFAAPPSTNPCRPLVDEFKLVNYDPALDNIDYSVPYKEIQWPWKTDPEKRATHTTALTLLHEAGAQFDLKVAKSKGLEQLAFTEMLDEWGEEIIFVPDKVTAELLEKTLPYIPEIKRVYLCSTSQLTDKGLLSLYYLPLLDDVTLGNFGEAKQQISDEGIEYILRLPSLECLNLFERMFTAAIIESITQNARNLYYLSLNGTFENTISFSSLGKLQKLKDLSLSTKHTPKTETVPSIIDVKIFHYLSLCSECQRWTFSGVNFLSIPDDNIVKALRQISKRKKMIWIMVTDKSPIHPLLVKEWCGITSLTEIVLLGRYVVNFTPDHPICYERVMYEMRKKNAVPEYYQALEKEFEEQLKYRWWSDRKGRDIRAKMTDRTGTKITLVRQDDQKQFVLPIKSLSDDDQLYLKELDRLEAEIQAEK